MPVGGSEANVLVPNSGPAQVETTAIQLPDGSIAYRQRADIGDGTDVPQIRALLEQFITLWAAAQPLPPSASGRAVAFDENNNIRSALGTSFTGGATSFKLIALATTNAISVKNSLGQIYGWYLFNAAVTTRFVKLYNTQIQPNVGVDVPVLTLPLPAGAAANVSYPHGIGSFSRGIGLAITVNAADSDATAVTAGDVILNLFYS